MLRPLDVKVGTFYNVIAPKQKNAKIRKCDFRRNKPYLSLRYNVFLKYFAKKVVSNKKKLKFLNFFFFVEFFGNPLTKPL